MKAIHPYLFLSLLGLGAILSFALRLWAFQQASFATGWDSYFYLIQLKSLIEEGEMHSADWSLIYPLLWLMQSVISDYELTFNYCAALLAACFTLNAGLLTRKMTKNWALALLAVAFTLFSPHLTYFAAQYPKNLLGLSFFLLLIGQIPSLFGNPITIKQGLWCGSLLLLNLFGHRMTMVLGVVFLLMVLVIQKLPTKWLVMSLLGFLGIVLLGIFLPGVLSLADVSRFEHLLSTQPQWAIYSFWETFEASRISTAWLVELGIVGALWFALFLFVLMTFRKQVQKSSFIWLLLCLLLIFPFFKWSLDGIGYRLFLAYVLLMPFGLWLMLGNWKRFNSSYVALSLFVSCLGFLSISGYQPKKHDPPYALYRQLTKRSLRALAHSEIELLIAHKSLAEYFTFYSRIDVLPWLPEYPIEKEKLWRIATVLNANEFQYLVPTAQCHRLSSNYYLIREDQWQLFLSRLEEASGKEALTPFLTWKNPHQVRPFYLLKNK